MGIGRSLPITSSTPSQRWNWLPGTLGLYAFLGGLLTLVGWAVGIRRLIDWELNGITMKPNAALAAAASGLGLMLIASSHPRAERAGRWLGIGVALLGALTLSEHLVGWDLGIDILLWNEPAGERATMSPGRMGPPASTAFLLIGTALALLPGRPASQRAASVLGAATIGVAALPLTGYLFQTDLLFAAPRLTGIALQTATMLLGLGVGLMAARRRVGVAAVVTAPGPGGAMARAMLAAVVAVPVLTGWGVLWLAHRGIADAPFALALMTVVMVLGGGVMVLLTAWKVERTATALREREEQFRLFFEQSVFGAGEADPRTGRLLMVNDRYCQITGCSRQELLSGRVGDLTHPDDRAADATAFQDMVDGRTGEYSREKRYIRKDGRVIWVHATARLIRDQQGAPVRLWGTLHDVSDRKVAEEQALEQRALLATMTDHARVGMVVINADHRYLYANPAYAEILGMPTDSIIGRTVAEVLPLAYAAEIRPRLDRAFAGERVHYEALPDPADVRTSRARYFSATYEPQLEGGVVRSVVVVVSDVTASRTAAELLRRGKEHLSLAMEAARMVSWSWDIGSDRIEVSDNYADVFGRPPPSSAREGFATVHPDDAEEYERVVRSALAASSGFRTEIRIIRPDDGRTVWFDARGMMVADEDGTPAMTGVVIDITERKAAEAELAAHRNRLQELVEKRTAELAASVTRLHAAERLAALGNLAAGLGHDLANLVMPMRGRLEALGAVCATPESREDVASIARALDHLSALSSGMRLMALDPSRDSASSPVGDLAAWWKQTDGILRASLPREIRLVSEIPAGLMVAMAQHRLAQAVFNLVQNAGEALAGRHDGVIRIVIRQAPPDALASGARAVNISVIDNGPGMAPEVRARCFEPYFSTKGRAIATGMGLGLVRGLVESAGGTVSVQSEPGNGAIFTLTIPAAPATQATSPPVQRAAALTVTDARSAALASMMLSALAVRIAHPARDAVPDEDLWVAQTPTRTAVEAYLAGCAQRRVIVLGGLAGPGDPPPLEVPDRLVHLPLRPTPTALRLALNAAAGV